MKLFFRIILSIAIILNFNIGFATAKDQSLKSVKQQVKTVAVIDFENNTGLLSLDNLKRGLADSLISNLAKYESLTILERTRLNDAIKELSLSQTGFVSPDTAVKIGKITGSQYVILGAVSRIGETYEVGIRMVEVESSKIILGKSVRSRNEEAIYKGIDYLSLETANSLEKNVDKQALETARREAENYAPSSGNLGIILWIGGGILVLGAITGVVILALGGGAKQTNNNTVNIGSTSEETKPATNTLNFSFGIKI